MGGCIFRANAWGQSILLDDETWVIFREAIMLPHPGQPERPAAVFRPRFHVRDMSVQSNIRFSLLPMGFFLGLPGFRSKLWLYQPHSGDFAGYYEWDTLADAQAYARSFAMRFMTHRSVPGSVSVQILPAGQ